MGHRSLASLELPWGDGQATKAWSDSPGVHGLGLFSLAFFMNFTSTFPLAIHYPCQGWW